MQAASSVLVSESCYASGFSCNPGTDADLQAQPEDPSVQTEAHPVGAPAAPHEHGQSKVGEKPQTVMSALT